MSSTREQLIEQLGQMSKLLGDAKVAGAVVDKLVTNINHRDEKWSCEVATDMINATLGTACPDIKTAASAVIVRFTEVEYNLNRSLERIAVLEAELEQVNTIMPQDATATNVAPDCVEEVTLNVERGTATGRVKDTRTMDPDENLKRQRILVKRIEATATSTQTHEAIELAELVSALDSWICTGGYPPSDWNTIESEPDA